MELRPVSPVSPVSSLLSNSGREISDCSISEGAFSSISRRCSRSRARPATKGSDKTASSGNRVGSRWKRGITSGTDDGPRECCSCDDDDDEDEDDFRASGGADADDDDDDDDSGEDPVAITAAALGTAFGLMAGAFRAGDEGGVRLSIGEICDRDGLLAFSLPRSTVDEDDRVLAVLALLAADIVAGATVAGVGGGGGFAGEGVGINGSSENRGGGNPPLPRS